MVEEWFRELEIGVFAADQRFVQAQPGGQQHADGDRHIHVAGATTHRLECGEEKGTPGIGDDRQGDQGGKPVECLARRAVRARAAADPSLHPTSYSALPRAISS